MVERQEQEKATALNIVIVPPDDVANLARGLSRQISGQFATEFMLDSADFRPHITICQGLIPDKNHDLLRASLQKLGTDTENFEMCLEDFSVSPGGFVWWDARKSPEVMVFHNKVLDIVNNYREGLISPPAQSQLPRLGEKEAENVRKTGSIYQGELYIPHLTLTRLKNPEDRQGVLEALGKAKPVALGIDRIFTARLGEHGTISQDLGVFRFKKETVME